MGCIDGKRNRRMQVQSTTRSPLSSVPASMPTQSGGDATSSPFAAVLGTHQAQSDSPKQSAASLNEPREQNPSAAATTAPDNKDFAEAVEARLSETSKSDQLSSKSEEPKSKRTAKTADPKIDPKETAEKTDAVAGTDQPLALLTMIDVVAPPPANTRPAPPTNWEATAVPAQGVEKPRNNSRLDNALPEEADANPSSGATAGFAVSRIASRDQKPAEFSRPLHDESKGVSASVSRSALSASQSSAEQKDLADASQANSPAVKSADAEQAVIASKPSAAAINFGAAHDSHASAPVASMSENANKATELKVDVKTSISVVHTAAPVQHARRESASGGHSGENRKQGDADQPQIAGAQVSNQPSGMDDAKSAAAKSESAIAPPQLSQASLAITLDQPSATAIHSHAAAGDHEPLNSLPAQPTSAAHAASAVPSLSSARLVAHQQYSEVQLNIHSQDLGAVQIRATMRAGQIGAAITTDRPEAREALASAIPALHQTLRDRDVKVEQITIADRTSTLAAFNSGTGSQSGFSQQQSRQNSTPSIPQYGVADQETAIAVETSRVSNESALVDIHA